MSTQPDVRRKRKSLGAPLSAARRTEERENARRKGSRSKSIGPGGLDALQQASGNRRASLAALPKFQPRSILKPTTPGALNSNTEALLDLDFGENVTATGSKTFHGQSYNLSQGAKIALRAEEEQQVSLKEREERERREARRKSLANRRVSFAAEATLHTFHEIEYQDAAACTNSARRASTAALATSHQQTADQPGRAPVEVEDHVHPRGLGHQQSDWEQDIDDTVASSMYGSDSDLGESVEEVEDHEDTGSPSDSSDDDGTMVTVDGDETTSASVASADSSTVDEALRLAARHADTQKPSADDGTEAEEIIPSFGWAKKVRNDGALRIETLQTELETIERDSTGMDLEMEMTQAIGGIIRHGATKPVDNNDMSMDVTRAFGTIFSRNGQFQHNMEDAIPTPYIDHMVKARCDPHGQVIKDSSHGIEDISSQSNEDMSMELTTVMGGLISTENGDTHEHDETLASIKRNLSYVGGELNQAPALPLDASPDDSAETVGMDITTALGKILPTSSSHALGSDGALEVDMATTPGATLQPNPQKPNSPTQVVASGQDVLDVSYNPVMASFTEHIGVGKQNAADHTIPKNSSQSPTPTVASQVAKALDGSGPQPISPKKRSISPNQRHDAHGTLNGFASPQTPILLTPQGKRLPTFGLEKEGLGSPRVSALLDRRGSIGEVSCSFTPGRGPIGRRVVFNEPLFSGATTGIECRGDKERSSDQKSLDDAEVTVNLKEMIASLSPKKNHRGRKSLHVGSARGVLGKRPTELDDSEEEKDGIKRLKGHHGSPIKNVRLQQPPGSVASMLETSAVPEPREPPNEPGITSSDLGARSRIHLQDFLNMISVSFMELTTSKRRQTQAPSMLRDCELDISLERCVISGACTVPVLELYQHSCRELKKYISEGRRIVKEIEVETYQDNPPLFQEYASATSEFKMLMDHQFKNGKTHARLLSKAMWYEWRMKLQHGLREGLERINHDMDEDIISLENQRQLVDSSLPTLASRYESLVRAHGDLEIYAKELAECDQNELNSARHQLVELEASIQARKKQIAELRTQLQLTESRKEQVSLQKDRCMVDIKEAEKVREECKGWTAKEISVYKEKVQSLEKQYHWAVTGVAGARITMTYKGELAVAFDITDSQHGWGDPTVEARRVFTKSDAPTRHQEVARDFFLQRIRGHSHKNDRKLSSMLSLVAREWETARCMVRNINVADTTYPTKVTRTSNTSIEVVSTLLVTELETKIEVIFAISLNTTRGDTQVTIEPSARVVYGEAFNLGKMKDYLTSRIKQTPGEHDVQETWCNILVSLHRRLLTRGRKVDS